MKTTQEIYSVEDALKDSDYLQYMTPMQRAFIALMDKAHKRMVEKSNGREDNEIEFDLLLNNNSSAEAMLENVSLLHKNLAGVLKSHAREEPCRHMDDADAVNLLALIVWSTDYWSEEDEPEADVGQPEKEPMEADNGTVTEEEGEEGDETL